VNWRLPQIYFFAFPFAKEKLDNIFVTFKKRNNRERLITAVRRENNVKCTITPIDAVLETPSL